MIVVVARASTDASRRAELIRVSERVAVASRAEAGCLGYRIYEETERANEFVFIEEWEDEAALQAHFATPHIAEFMGSIMATVTSTPDIQFHTIASTRTLADVRAG